MPPKNKFSREQIVTAAFEIAKEDGVEGITAQKIAKKLNSSVAPIYVNFKDIDELKNEVVKKILKINLEMNEVAYTGNRFLDMGIASIKFAKEYKVFFHEIITNQKRYTQNYDRQEIDKEVIEAMKNEEELRGFTDEELFELLIKIRIFTIGLAASYVNGILPDDFSEEKCIEMLERVGCDIASGLERRRGLT